MAIKSVMSESAPICVHLNYHIGHYDKILLDEIFGEQNFRIVHLQILITVRF